MRAPLNFPPGYLVSVPGGDSGIASTIAEMKKLMHGPTGVRSLLVRHFTLQAVRGVERGMREIDAVFHAVKDNIEFREEYQETLQSPEFTIREGAGDCDDQAMLAATMLESLGFETRFKTVGDSENLSHVYVEVRDKSTGRWVSLDTTVAESYPGWEPDGMARSEVYGANSSNDGVLLIAAAAVAALFL